MEPKDYSSIPELDSNLSHEEAGSSFTGYPGGVLVMVSLIALLVGGGIGWMVGRQSKSEIVVDAISSAASNIADTPSVLDADTPPPVLETGLTSPDDAPSEGETIENSGGGAIEIVDTTAVDTIPNENEAYPLPTPTFIEPELVTVMGDPNAPVTIVEFSDYECPFCGRYSQTTLPLIKENYIDTGRVYYVFKDYPLTSLHPTAPRVHEVGQCVLELEGVEAYWEAHDLFFQTQSRWGGGLDQTTQDDILVELMSGLGVFETDLRDCLADGRYTADVQADMSEGEGLGISGTPTFFINGFPIVGALPYDVFEQAIALAENGDLAEAIAEGQRAQQQQAEAQAQADADAQAAASQPVNVEVGDAPGKGDPNAPITIVEYSDYQCPFCARHVANTMPILQNYIDIGQVYYVFKDFPLDSIHPQAQKAHESAHCAREQGGDTGYWQMHDLLFTNQGIWQSVSLPNHIPIFKGLAAKAGLETAEFDECLDSGRYYDVVRANVAEGIQFGITGTPTFFINGQRLVGAQPISMFDNAISLLLNTSE